MAFFFRRLSLQLAGLRQMIARLRMPRTPPIATAGMSALNAACRCQRAADVCSAAAAAVFTSFSAILRCFFFFASFRSRVALVAR